MIGQSSEHKQIKLGIDALLSESKRFFEESKSKDISARMPSIRMPTNNVSPEIKEIFENLANAIKNNCERVHYDIMKFQLANKALNTGLWDMEVVAGNSTDPNNKFTWSNEFRRMLGFRDEQDFPNLTSSWVDRLHPEDKDETLNAFARHLDDHTGRTPYNLEYRCQLKNGEYRWFQAIGETVRDSAGVPLRVAGLFLDIHERKLAAETERQLREQLKHAFVLVEDINKLIIDLDNTIDLQAKAINISSKATETIVDGVKYVSEKVVTEEVKSIELLKENAEQGAEAMKETILSVNNISKSIGGISDAITIISKIAASTNLLAINASIESAHAGNAGRGFAVVADEIRRLAVGTKENSKSIAVTLQAIIDRVNVTTTQSNNTAATISQIHEEIVGFAELVSTLVTTLDDLKIQCSQVIEGLKELQGQSHTVKSGYTEILAMTKQLSDVMAEYCR